MGIASAVLAAMNSFQGAGGQTGLQNLRSEMGQLGQDLQSGNLAQAQTDFSALLQNVPGETAAASIPNPASSNPLTQTFNRLGQDLQSGNMRAAQQDYATIQQDVLQNVAQLGLHARHHHHTSGSQDSESTQQTNPIAQAFSQLAQDLQSGNLQGSQQAFITLQNDLQQFIGLPASGSGAASTIAPASSSSLNVII